MKNVDKYGINYFPVGKEYSSWADKDHIEKAPVWCSVDLRDGNQSLVIPMSIKEKTEYFKTLVQVGFKEIEVGFPAASETEYEFVRTLIDKNLIPQDVTIQVLTQCREHIIRKTFEALKGAPRAIIHFYNSISLAQREQVFEKSREEMKQMNTVVISDSSIRRNHLPERSRNTPLRSAMRCLMCLSLLRPTMS